MAFSGNEFLFGQLSCNTLEQCLGARLADTVLERPGCRAIRDGGRVGQTTETLYGLYF